MANFKNNKATIATRLCELREKHGFTQREIAKMLGITISALSQYETNKRKPKNDVLIKLSKIYNTSTDYLLCTTDYPDIKKTEYDLTIQKELPNVSTPVTKYETNQTRALKEELKNVIATLESLSEKKQQLILPLLKDLVLTFKNIN